MAAKASTAAKMRADVANLKRERILEAAVDLFYRHGYQNTTLDHVAESLGVTKPFIYSYFDSKADLLAAICEQGVASALRSISAIATLDLDPKSRLERMCRAMVNAVITNQKQNAISAREEKNLPPEYYRRIARTRRAFDKTVRSVLEEGCAAGQFSVRDSHLATFAISGIGTWVQVWYRFDGRLTPDEIADGVTELVLKMVAAGSPAHAEDSDHRAVAVGDERHL
jgi:AcrR family transcriptional regulator